MIGPPETQIHSLIVTLNIEQLKYLYLNSEQFVRMPDTTNRIILFFLALVLLLCTSIINNEVAYYNKNNYTNAVKILIGIFMLSILSTCN